VQNKPTSDGSSQVEFYDLMVKKVFKDACINKMLVHDSHARELPRYIFEWLVSKYQSDGNLTPEAKQELYQLIDEHFPEPERIELYKYRILRQGEEIALLNPLRVRIDSLSNTFVPYMPFFAGESKHLLISDEIVDKNKGLLLNGLWGISTIAPGTSDYKPFKIKSFTPVQIEEVRIEDFIEARGFFSLPEWVDLLINTMGLNPREFPSIAEKVYLVARLIPYVENNFNLVEMGPKGTGKSFIHKNISTHVHVIGGGTVSRAQLFYQLARNERGLLLMNDVVVFDDFSNIRLEQANEVIGKLKNYMADGKVDVGKFNEAATTSVVIMGNVAINEQGEPRERFHFRNLPREMQESAFLDRIAAFIPGWRLHAIRGQDLSSNYGLIGDWFSEVLHQFRRRNHYMADIETKIHFNGRTRDETCAKATASGLIKLLFPNKNLADEDWRFVAKIAVDMRQRVLDQLAYIDAEFQDKHVSFDIIQ